MQDKSRLDGTLLEPTDQRSLESLEADATRPDNIEDYQPDSKWIGYCRRGDLYRPIYFGTFDSYEELYRWAIEHQVTVEPIELKDPYSNPVEWWT